MIYSPASKNVAQTPDTTQTSPKVLQTLLWHLTYLATTGFSFTPTLHLIRLKGSRSIIRYKTNVLLL
jgi:hypothetical protein